MHLLSIMCCPVFSGRSLGGKPLFSRRSAAFALVCKIDSGATVIACRNPRDRALLTLFNDVQIY